MSAVKTGPGKPRRFRNVMMREETYLRLQARRLELMDLADGFVSLSSAVDDALAKSSPISLPDTEQEQC